MKKVIATLVVGALLAVSAIGCQGDNTKKTMAPGANAPQVAQNAQNGLGK
ncbi:MAG TPA: hypothetical protein VMS17_12575 [Gemmataceae bacterium]|nr:hypothetical protein [Gemmataceae bacterium]